jgi:hypothetical protein
MKVETDLMTPILRTFTAAALLAAAAPAAAQTLLLDVNLNLPLAATLDNPCTPQTELIAFTGSTALAQRVWLLPSGNLRLQFEETTSISGVDTLGGLLGGGARYSASGTSVQDIEFAPLSFSVLQYKPVTRTGAVDNFHSVLVLVFDPQNLRLQLKLEAACDNGMP